MENVILGKETLPGWRQALMLVAISLVTVFAWAVLSSLGATQGAWMEINILFIFLSVYVSGYRYAQLFASRLPAGVAILLGVVTWTVWLGVFAAIGLAFS